MNTLNLNNTNGFPVLLSFAQIEMFTINARVIVDQPINVGDKVRRTFVNRDFETCIFDGEVEAVIESRPARGAWHPTTRPDYYEVLLNGTITRKK